MKSQNTIHETLIHSPAGRVLGFHSLYFGISFMYLRPLSKIQLVNHGISYSILKTFIVYLLTVHSFTERDTAAEYILKFLFDEVEIKDDIEILLHV